MRGGDRKQRGDAFVNTVHEGMKDIDNVFNQVYAHLVALFIYPDRVTEPDQEEVAPAREDDC